MSAVENVIAVKRQYKKRRYKKHRAKKIRSRLRTRIAQLEEQVADLYQELRHLTNTPTPPSMFDHDPLLAREFGLPSKGKMSRPSEPVVTISVNDLRRILAYS